MFRQDGITVRHSPQPTSAHSEIRHPTPPFARRRFERSIKKSSIFLPALSCVTIHRGCLPRPAQVSDGSEGFRNLGRTGGYFRRTARRSLACETPFLIRALSKIKPPFNLR